MNIIMLGLIDARTSDASNIHFWEVASALSRRHHTVTALVPRGDYSRFLKQSFIKIIELPFSYRERLSQAIVMNMVQILWYMLKADKDTDVVYIRWRLLPAGIVRFVGRLWGINARIISEHNGWVSAEVLLQRQSKLLARLAYLVQMLDAGTADRVITVTEGIKDLLVRGGINPTRIRVVGNGTNPDHFHPLSERASLKRQMLGHTNPTLGFIGHIARWQGLEDLVECFLELAPQFPELRLVIVGSGPYTREIENLIRGSGIEERVVLTGNMAYEYINRWMNVIDIAFIPKSRQLEVAGYSPLKLRDYAAAGKVVVASDVSGLREFEPEGWLKTYKPEVKGDCARVLKNLLRNPLQRQRMEIQARQYALEHFTWDRVVEQISQSLEGD